MEQERPWESEPNEFVWEASGLKCKIRRVSWSGHLCGYVGIPESHPWFGKEYGDEVPATRAQLERECNIEKIGVINLLCAGKATEEETEIVLLVDVHGGLTWSDKGADELEGLWVFGFDCAHWGDLCPFSTEYARFHHHQTYRDFEFVKDETESLARQLAAIQGEQHVPH